MKNFYKYDDKKQIEWEDQLENWIRMHYKDITNLFEQEVKRELALCLQELNIAKIPSKEIYVWFQIQGHDLLDIYKCENCGKNWITMLTRKNLILRGL